tara:strand:+ start:1948 stop:2202 length:255 start_codon:yes stop_codon:yes gene_type:complete
MHLGFHLNAIFRNQADKERKETNVNIYSKLREGYTLAKTPEQIAKVEEWHKKIDARMQSINRMLDEILKPNPEIERIRKELTKR